MQVSQKSPINGPAQAGSAHPSCLNAADFREGSSPSTVEFLPLKAALDRVNKKQSSQGTCMTTGGGPGQQD